METGITYGERSISIDIGKAKDNFDKDRKPKCFNYNIYGHMVKDYKKQKKKQDTKKCYKYKKVEHIAKNYRLGQKIKNWSVEEKSDTESDRKEQGFGDSSE